MITYYLRAEAVNLMNFVYDTHDISTIRGGSFLIRQAFQQEKEWKELGLETISLEANTGLFSFKTLDDKEAEKLRLNVLSKLDKACQNYATFVVDILPKTDDFRKDMQLLMAKNRWRQFRELSVRLPNLPAQQYCDLDGVSPASNTIKVGNEKKIISQSAHFRRRQGIDLRRNLSRRLIGSEDIKFTEDLQSLAEDSSRGNLDGKLAYISLDGNRFGAIRDTVCGNEQALSDFQKYLQEDVRLNALQKILGYAQKTTSFKTTEGKTRFEMLMWGGDEIDFVVPAWVAWRILSLFFKSTGNAQFKNMNLTHSAGLVFSHANAPILYIRSLAKTLCDAAKESIPKEPDRLNSTHNRIAFLALESFDQINQDTRSFVKAFLEPAQIEDLVIIAQEMQTLETNLIQIKRYFPRNKVYEILDLIRNPEVKNRETKIAEMMDKVIDRISVTVRKKTRDAIKAIVHENPKRWFIIADLWDFIGEEGEK